MKRNIVRCLSPLLALILVFMSAAQPAAAAESSYFNVLDYSYPNNGDSTLVWYTDSVSFQVPYSQILSVDIVIKCNVPDLSAQVVQGSTALNLNVSLIHRESSTYFYRLFGETPGYTGNSFSLRFNWSSGHFIQFLSVRGSYISTTSFLQNTTLKISNNDDTNNSVLNFTGSTIQYVKVPSDVSLNNQFIAYLYPTNISDWKKYDFWDVQLFMQVGEIDSVSAVMGDINLPIEYNYLNDASVAVSEYYVTVSVDLRDLIRTSSDYPMIMITGSYFTGQNRISLFGSTGSIFIDTEEKSFPVFQGIRSVLNSIHSFIQAQLPSIQNHLSSIGNAFDNFRSEFSDYFEVMVDRLDILDDFRIFFENIEAKIGEVKITIVEYGHNIILAIKGDSKDTEELDQSSSQIRDDVSDVHQFEQDQQAVLDNNFSVIQNAVTVTSFAAALAFVQGYANHMFVGLGNVKLIFTLPLFLGLFFYVCSRIPGATRWKSSPPSSVRSPTGTKASGKGGSSK